MDTSNVYVRQEHLSSPWPRKPEEWNSQMVADQDTFQEHSEAPYHQGTPENVDEFASLTRRNPTCGDEVTVFLRIVDSRVTDAYFTTKGCMLCRTASSVLCENLEGESTANVLQIDARTALRDIGISVTPGRMQCVLISLETVQRCLAQYESQQHD